MASNSYPIVLVHGFAGWGRGELIGLKYWGGIQGDIQQQLKAKGYTVYTAAVGPFSSNWDRACELYAQIKGGRVDYGVNHSKFHGHERFGRTFAGLYPQWGELNADGKVNKVHLVGHSMGGQTVRMLAQLLAKGSKGAPVEEATTTHALFAGGKDWVHSITTIATPNQGTLLSDGFSEVGSLVKATMGALFASINALGGVSDDLYDAKLDQWGISPRGDKESLADYIGRVLASRMFKPGFKDVAMWSLSTKGAKEESTWVQTLPEVYYFSYVTLDTKEFVDFGLHKVQVPNPLTMFLPLQPLAVFLGGDYAPTHGFSEEWQPNDGVVNSISMKKDLVGDYVEFTGTAERGVWNGMPTLNSMDHLAVTGLTIHTNVLKKLYSAHAKLLAALPITFAPETKAHEEALCAQQAACDRLTEVTARLQLAVVAESAAKKAATRHEMNVLSEQQQQELDSGISVAWEGDDTIKPIPVYEQEP